MTFEQSMGGVVAQCVGEAIIGGLKRNGDGRIKRNRVRDVKSGRRVWTQI